MRTTRRGDVEYLRIALKGSKPSNAKWIEIGQVRQLYPHLVDAWKPTFGGPKAFFQWEGRDLKWILKHSYSFLNSVKLILKFQSAMNVKLIRNNLWTMAICGQHETTRTLGQSAQTFGPWRLCLGTNWQMGGQIKKQRQFLIVYRRASLSVKENPQALGHEEKHKIVQKSPIPLEGESHAKTGRISGGLQAVSRFDRIPWDAIHWVTCVQRMREKTAYIARVKVTQLNRVIWTKTIIFGGFKSTMENWFDGWPNSTGK